MGQNVLLLLLFFLRVSTAMAEHTGSCCGLCISRMGSKIPAVESSLLVIHETDSLIFKFQVELVTLAVEKSALLLTPSL